MIKFKKIPNTNGEINVVIHEELRIKEKDYLKLVVDVSTVLTEYEKKDKKNHNITIHQL